MKEMSARKVMAIMFSVTYCLVIALCTIALMNKIIEVATYVSLLATFTVVVREIVADYFDRKDRANETPTKEIK